MLQIWEVSGNSIVKCYDLLDTTTGLSKSNEIYIAVLAKNFKQFEFHHRRFKFASSSDTRRFIYIADCDHLRNFLAKNRFDHLECWSQWTDRKDLREIFFIFAQQSCFKQNTNA